MTVERRVRTPLASHWGSCGLHRKPGFREGGKAFEWRLRWEGCLFIYFSLTVIPVNLIFKNNVG